MTERAVAPPRGSRIEVSGRPDRTLPALAGFVTVAALSFANGGYFPTAWGWSALALSWLAAILLVVRPRVRVPLLGGAMLAALIAFALWVSASIAWSASRSQSVLESQRALEYVAALCAFFVVMQRGSVRALLAGVLTAIVAVSTYALATRLFPERLGSFDPVGAYRLSEPLGYWNTLGLFAGMGAILALGFAARAKALPLRALAAGSLPILLATVYFTFGRGAWIALAAGIAAVIALDPRRLQLITALAVLVPAPALTVFLCSRSAALTHAQSSLAAASREGHRLAGLILVLGLASASISLVLRVLEERLQVPKTVVRAYGLVLAVAAVLLLAATFARYGSPPTIVGKAHAAFTAPPPSARNLNARLFSFSGNGRADLWRAAWDDYRQHPWVGSGGGSYEQYWLRHRGYPLKVRDAHSLYIETLAELGPVGLGLLIAVFGVPVVAAFKARRHPLVPAALGAYAAFLVHASADWDWEMTGVTVTALTCAAAIVGAGRSRGDAIVPARVRVAMLACMFAFAAFALVGLLGSSALSSGASAASDGRWAESKEKARTAMRWAPWSSRPWALLGEAQLEQGDFRAARRSLRTALSKDPRDWSLWFDLALASGGEARRSALAEAARLNPLSPELAQYRGSIARTSSK